MKNSDKTAPDPKGRGLSPQGGGQAGAPQQSAAENPIAPRKADSPRPGEQAGSPPQPVRFSQQQAQNVPADPDPDDPASP